MSRLIDYIYYVLFPAGYHTVVISLYIFIVIIAIFLIQKVLIKDFISEKMISLNLGIRGFSIIFLTGLFSPIIMAFYASLMFLILFFNIISTIKKSSTPQKIMKIALLVILGLFFIVQYALWTYILFRYSMTEGLVLVIGLTLGGFFFIEQKVKGMHLLLKVPDFMPNLIKSVKIIAVLLPVVSAGIFLPIVFIRPHEVPPSNSYTGTISLEIMSYNIRNPGAIEKDSRDMWNNRKYHVASYIASFDLDIFGVQEAYIKQLEFLWSNLPNRNYEYIGTGRNEGTFGGELEAIFYDKDKFDYIDGDIFWISDTPLVPSKNWDKNNYRSCEWVRFEDKTTNMQFFVFNTHLSRKTCNEVPCIHQKSAELINNKIVELTGDLPVILLGDFNMQNTSLAFSYLEEYGDKPLHDAFKEFNNGSVPFDYTTNEFRPLHPDLNKKRIDYIFLSESIVTEFHEIPKDLYDDNRAYSDHYPVIATISIS